MGRRRTTTQPTNLIHNSFFHYFLLDQSYFQKAIELFSIETKCRPLPVVLQSSSASTTTIIFNRRSSSRCSRCSSSSCTRRYNNNNNNCFTMRPFFCLLLLGLQYLLSTATATASLLLLLLFGYMIPSCSAFLPLVVPLKMNHGGLNSNSNASGGTWFR